MCYNGSRTVSYYNKLCTGVTLNLISTAEWPPLNSLARKESRIVRSSSKEQTANYSLLQAASLDCSLYCKLQVYDSLFSNINKQTRNIIQNLFQATSYKRLDIKFVRCQKQTGGKDCGMFSIAFAPTIAFGVKMTKFCQELMRAHLVECLNKKAHVIISL